MFRETKQLRDTNISAGRQGPKAECFEIQKCFEATCFEKPNSFKYQHPHLPQGGPCPAVSVLGGGGGDGRGSTQSARESVGGGRASVTHNEHEGAAMVRGHSFFREVRPCCQHETDDGAMTVER